MEQWQTSKYNNHIRSMKYVMMKGKKRMKCVGVCVRERLVGAYFYVYVCVCMWGCPHTDYIQSVCVCGGGGSISTHLGWHQ